MPSSTREISLGTTAMQTSNEVKPARILRTAEFSIIEKRKMAVCLHPYEPAKRRVVYLTLRTEKETRQEPVNSAEVHGELNAEERVEMFLCIKKLVRGDKCRMAITV